MQAQAQVQRQVRLQQQPCIKSHVELLEIANGRDDAVRGIAVSGREFEIPLRTPTHNAVGHRKVAQHGAIPIDARLPEHVDVVG